MEAATKTIGDVLVERGVSIPDELVAQMAVPVLKTQRQGDVLVVDREDPDLAGNWDGPMGPLSDTELKNARKLDTKGVQIVRGEQTNNTHTLHGEPGTEILWVEDGTEIEGLVTYGHAKISGGPAYLVHSDEHGVNGLDEGTYSFTGKREQADLVRRVAD